MSRRILVTGEAIGDFIPCDGEGRHYEAVLGGSGFNTALAIARAGGKVAYAVALSTDALGGRFRRALVAEGIAADLIRDSSLPTAVAIVSPLGPDGVPEFGLHLDGTAEDEPGAVPLLCPPGTLHLHATSFAALRGETGASLPVLLRSAREAGAGVSYDINIRASVLPDRAEARPLVGARIALADIAKASRDDLAWLYPNEAPDAIAASWLALGAKLVLISEGGAGCRAYSAEGMIQVTAPAVEIADTVGAGDCLMGTFLAELAESGDLGAGLADLSLARTEAALRIACAAAADCCTRPGCDPPRRRMR